MTFYELAKRIANFIWDLDPYDMPYDNVGELIIKVLQDLTNTVERNLIAEFLYSCETETEYAQILAREVCNL